MYSYNLFGVNGIRVVTYGYLRAVVITIITSYDYDMSTYKRAPLNFKERLATRRDEIVLAELELLQACILILEPQKQESTQIEREGR